MIPFSHGFTLSIILFTLGLLGVVIRRNFLFMLLGLEIMINASALMFVLVGNYLGQEDGQIVYILILTIAAAESSVCLSLLLQLYSDFHTLNIDKINRIHR